MTRGRPRMFDRDAALQQAMELFWARGFDNTSIAELSASMGVAPPSLYAAFGSKEQLFEEAVARYGDVEGGEIWSALREDVGAREAIRNFLSRTAVSFTRRDRPRGCLVVLGALHPAGDSGEPRRRLQARRAGNLREVEARLERAARNGELPPETDVKALARFYVTVQQGMSIQARDGASRKELLAIADAAMAAWPLERASTEPG